MSTALATPTDPASVAGSCNPAPDAPRVGLVSLGCAKNLVDSEIMLGALKKDGFIITNNAAEADLLIVNTCSFIDSAKEESIDAIFEANRVRGMRKQSREQKLIVAGCMAQRFQKELPDAMPEVDAFIGLDQVAEIAPIVREVLQGGRDLSEGSAEQPGGRRSYVTPRPRYIPDWDTPRVRLTPKQYAYVKIAEGCNHPCTFCVIPRMRGRHRSRTVESVLQEARELVAAGTKELLLISQDTTYFGMDLWEERAGPRAKVESARGQSLIHLLQGLEQIEGDFWVRLLYTHPAHWSDELIAAIAACKKVVRYIDIPLQHIHGEILDRMQRETSEQHIVDLLARIRAGIPGVAIRTTFIVGFPGEKEKHFARMLEFIEQTRFERLGVFQYSQEEGSRAASLDQQVAPATRKKRFERAMELQHRLAREIQASRIGQELRVLVDSPGIARSEADSPEIDGRVYVSKELPVGEFATVRIAGATDYDLIAEGAEMGVVPSSRPHRAER